MHCSETKIRRRKSKYQKIIKEDCGLNLSDIPTPFIMVCNGGLVNGITQEIILERFMKYGIIEDIAMIPGKSYCFVSYKEVGSSEAALAGLNNKENWPQIRGPIFLSYAEKIPEAPNSNFNFKEKPSGLHVLENFLTVEEEEMILRCIGNDLTHDTEKDQSVLKNRKVSHFGYEFKYFKNNVDVNEPIREIPKELDFIWDRVLQFSNEIGWELKFKPDQLTVNNYQPGQGIPPHVDTHSAFDDPIFSLSLQSSVIMEFKNSGGKCNSVLLPARSMCIMSGESRYGWTHGIASRKSDVIPLRDGGLTLQFRKERTSLTFRKVKQKDCTCKFPDFCDTRKSMKKEILDAACKNNLALNENLAAKLEDSYVHEVYEKISDHFSETRHKPWPNVLEFVNSLPSGSILLDVGCGNGKYFGGTLDHFQLGCDASTGLMEVCSRRGFECFTCNCLKLPVRDGSVDGCISIAVIHHLVTEERRKRAISEMIRVLRSTGRALIYVWAKNQERFNEKSSYLKQNTRKDKVEEVHGEEEEKIILRDAATDLMLPIHRNRTNFTHSDLLVPWKLKQGKPEEGVACKESSTYLRFYHVFEDDELMELCMTFDGIRIVNYYYDQGNWCIILEKL